MTARTATLRRVIRSVAPEGEPVPDGELLRRFARDDDQAAFAAVVRRHTPLVLGVCRRVLPTAQDAEDACQAVFLVLARKAGSVCWRPSAAGWLYAVARKVAGNARVAARRRTRREAAAAGPAAVMPVDRMTGRELLMALDAELDRLPPRYRDPLVLCFLQGRTRDEAAAHLGIPLATLHTRIDRGRKRLAAALTRRGMTLGAGLLALVAAAPAGAASTRMANAVLAAVRGNIPKAVADLSRAVAPSGTGMKLVCLATTLFGAAVLVAGAVSPTAAGPPPDKPVPARAAPEASKEPAPEEDVSFSGRVVDADGRPVAGVTVHVIPRHGQPDAFEPVTAPAATDRDGRYVVRVPKARLTDPVSGDDLPALALATAAGFFPGWTADAADGRIVLARADARVAGRITDLEGRPVAGATVTVGAVYAPAGGTLDSWVDTLRRDREAHSTGNLGPAIPAESLPGVRRAATTDAAGRFEIPGYAKDRVVHAVVAGPAVATSDVGLLTRDVGPAALTATSAGTSYYGTAGVIAVKPSRPIAGVVRDRRTGEPVAGVTVRSLVMAGRHRLDTGLATTTSGKDGKFTLAGMPKGPGNTLLVVPGRGQPYLVTGVEVPDPGGLDPVAVDVVLDRGILIEGVVRDLAGRPVPNVNVAYLANRFNDRVTQQRFGGRSGAAAPSDADGKFQVVGLPGTGYLVAVGPGRSYLAATERAGDGSSETVQLDTVSYPVRADGLHAVYAIDVPRRAIGFRQNVVLERGANVAVAVVDRDGKPVPGCRCLWRRAGEDWQDEARPGEHRVEAVNPKQPRTVLVRHAGRNLVGVVSLPSGPGETTHRLVLQPGVTLTGRVLSDGDRARAGVSVSIFVRPSHDNAGDAQRFRDAGEKIVTDAAGRFRVPALVPGFTYEVSINGQFVADSTFRLDAGATGTKDLGDLHLRLAED
jgi:RNA polymerase sigma factor (sigma-70 family)